MTYEPTWEDVEAYPRLLERGSAPNMDDQKTPTPFRVVIDGEVIEVEAENAYDAIEKAQKAAKPKRQSNRKR
jgi:hypothetical protein